MTEPPGPQEGPAADPEQEAAGAPPPRLDEAVGWLGFEVDDLGGARVGRVRAVYVDAGSDAAGGGPPPADGDPVPAWLVVALEAKGGILRRRRASQLVAVPARNCAAAAGRVWVAHEGAALRAAPAVDPSRPLLREHELAICAHYGIGERVGRAAEVAARPEASTTSTPL